MLLGLDVLMIAVADPDSAAEQLERQLGLAATGGGRHDALGTFNRIAWLGDTYIELIGVFDQELARQSWLGAATLRALDSGGGLEFWAIATDAIDRDVAQLRATGSDLGEPIGGERRRDDEGVVRWRMAASPSVGPADPPSLVEHDLASAEWTPADRAARQAEAHPFGGPVRLEVLELRVDDVNGTIQRFLKATGLRFRPSLSGGGSRDAAVGDQTVRLSPMRGGSGSPALHLVATGGAATEPRTASIFGCDWVIRRLDGDPAHPRTDR
jgi:hypothetical protein